MDNGKPTSVASNRLTTGVPALDDILNGGVPAGSVIFITGLPGSGKTILCEQALFANAAVMPSVLYATTLSEPPIKMLQFSSKFSFFKPALLESVVHYSDLGSALRNNGPAGLLKRLEELIRELRPGFMVLDSFRVLREYFADVKGFRAFASDLMIMLSTWEVTSFLVGEYRLDDTEVDPEFAIADGIIHLSGTNESVRQKRYLNILKMRGTDAFLGRHFFEIRDDGLHLYPRMTPHVSDDYVLGPRRLGTAIAGLGEMLSGGLYEGGVALISGGSGSGKTLVASSFAVECARRGEPALYVSFEESPQQLTDDWRRLGWDVSELGAEGVIDVLHVAPSELDIDRHTFVIQERARACKARLVVIDSVSAFDIVPGNSVIVHDYLWGIADYFKRQGITLILTTEEYSFFEGGGAPERRMSYLADAVLLLRLVEVGYDVRRRVSVMKMRGSGHDTRIRELVIGEDGVKVPAET